MGKLIRIAFLALLSATGLVTVDCRADINAGFLAGMNINNFSTSPDVGSSSHVGLIVGGQVEFPLSDNLFLRPGLRFELYRDPGAPRGKNPRGTFDHAVSFLRA
jgi:hypothetical protein